MLRNSIASGILTINYMKGFASNFDNTMSEETLREIYHKRGFDNCRYDFKIN